MAKNVASVNLLNMPEHTHTLQKAVTDAGAAGKSGRASLQPGDLGKSLVHHNSYG